MFCRTGPLFLFRTKQRLKANCNVVLYDSLPTACRLSRPRYYVLPGFTDLGFSRRQLSQGLNDPRFTELVVVVRSGSIALKPQIPVQAFRPSFKKFLKWPAKECILNVSNLAIKPLFVISLFLSIRRIWAFLLYRPPRLYKNTMETVGFGIRRQ